MALSDPQTIKIGSVETEMPRINTGNFSSTYSSADGTIKLSLSTARSKRNRQVVRIDVSKITADPFITDQNVEVSSSFQFVVDRPLAGYTNAEAVEIAEGFVKLISASSYSVLTKLLGGES